VPVALLAETFATVSDFDVVLKFLTPFGVGGLLAYVMFLFYRQDFLRERTRHEGDRDRLERREDRLLQVIERNAAAYERLAVTIENLSTLIARGSPQGGEGVPWRKVDRQG
jgi:hypothetical protein